MAGRKDLQGILAGIESKMQYGAGESAGFRAAATLAANDAYFEILATGDWPQLRRSDEIGLRAGDVSTLLTFESGESLAPMPLDSVNILSLEISAPSYRTIQIVDASELYRRIQSGASTSGVPEYAAIVGSTAQYRQLAEAGTLTVKCDVASANDTLTVRVHYRTSDQLMGSPRWEDVTGDFGTGIALSKQAAAGYPVEMVSVPAGFVGTLSINDSTPTEIVRVQPREAPGTSSANANYRHVTGYVMRLYPKPSSDARVTISYILDPPPLTENEDVPLIPVAAVIEDMATAAMLRRARKVAMARDYEALAEKRLARILASQQKTQRVLTPQAGNILWQNGIF